MSKSKQPKHKSGIHLYRTAVSSFKKGGVYYIKTHWYWHLVSRNGRIIARSSETYTRKGNAVKSINVARKIFQDSIAVAGVYKAYYDHSKPDSPLQSYL